MITNNIEALGFLVTKTTNVNYDVIKVQYYGLLTLGHGG